MPLLFGQAREALSRIRRQKRLLIVMKESWSEIAPGDWESKNASQPGWREISDNQRKFNGLRMFSNVTPG
jgi:hypothetical protein